MRGNYFQISYKLNGKEMPLINSRFPVREAVSRFARDLHAVEQIYLANIDLFGDENPADQLLVDVEWDSHDIMYATTIRQMLEKMNVTNVMYSYDEKVTSL